jgi:HlyD family secretion protein
LANAEDRQLGLIRQEIASKQALYDQGLEARTPLLELQRQATVLEGSRAEHLGKIAGAQQSIGETKLEIINLRDERDAKTASARRDVQARLAESEEALRAAEDVLRRTDIRAPVAGVVMDLRFFTSGGVIEPGVPILDIMPQDDGLVAEVQVSPLDIDVVEPGLGAQVRLTVFKQRTTPMLNGVVTYVSAASVANEQTGKAYYKALIEIDARELARVKGAHLYSGMPVEGLIMTGKRTPSGTTSSGRSGTASPAPSVSSRGQKAGRDVEQDPHPVCDAGLRCTSRAAR